MEVDVEGEAQETGAPAGTLLAESMVTEPAAPAVAAPEGSDEPPRRAQTGDDAEMAEAIAAMADDQA
eukprot:9517903-Lingulodinium_polyedra.AAC.1